MNEILAVDLQEAIDSRTLDLVYQPQVSIDSGDIVGVEALVRWRHPRLGNIEPERLLAAADGAGLTGALDDWVLSTACDTAAAWQRAGLPALRMLVNMSAARLREGELAERVVRALADRGLDPRRFGVELTETTLMAHVEDTAEQLRRLRALGVEIALDDFGTGLSSLSCLRRLPLDAVKIDRSLVPRVTDDSDALPITRAIIAMAHSLGLKAVAEGVESEGQLELLAGNHCDAFQGFHFSAPLPAVQIETMLRAGRRLPLLERRRAARARTVLVVDGESWVVQRLRQQLPLRFGTTVRVEGFTDAVAALRRLREGPVDVIVSGLDLPGLDGIALMNHAGRLQPQAVRMMLLGALDLARVIEDERQVDVFRYVSKPWTTDQLLAHFDAALSHVDRQRAGQVLGEAARAEPTGPDAVTLELLELEQTEPGITSVARGPLDEVLLPSQLLTLPGDLWVSEPAPPATSRRPAKG